MDNVIAKNPREQAIIDIAKRRDREAVPTDAVPTDEGVGSVIEDEGQEQTTEETTKGSLDDGSGEVTEADNEETSEEDGEGLAPTAESEGSDWESKFNLLLDKLSNDQKSGGDGDETEDKAPRDYSKEMFDASIENDPAAFANALRDHDRALASAIESRVRAEILRDQVARDFKSQYAPIANDPDLFDLANRKIIDLQNQGKDLKTAAQQVGTDMMGWLSKLSAPAPQKAETKQGNATKATVVDLSKERDARKRETVVPMPVAGAKAGVAEKTEPTASEHIQLMRKKRGLIS